MIMRVVDERSVGAVTAAPIALALAAALGAAGAASGQAAPPNAYYGAAESENGAPAPVGTTIVAVADGEVQDSIEVRERGRYGVDPDVDPAGEKLQVSGAVDS
jgi:hypothetical protein